MDFEGVGGAGAFFLPDRKNSLPHSSKTRKKTCVTIRHGYQLQKVQNYTASKHGAFEMQHQKIHKFGNLVFQSYNIQMSHFKNISICDLLPVVCGRAAGAGVRDLIRGGAIGRAGGEAAVFVTIDRT